MNSTHIELTYYELMSAALVGIMRQIENISARRSHKHGADSALGWQYHITGAIGEQVIAKYLNVYWTGKGKLRDPDVGTVDVRASSRDNGDLILHEDDPDDRFFWLVTGLDGNCRVRGFIRARDGKKIEYWKDPVGNRAAYFVPQSVLSPPEQWFSDMDDDDECPFA